MSGIDIEFPAALRMLALARKMQAGVSALNQLTAAAQDDQPEPQRSRARRALTRAVKHWRPHANKDTPNAE